MIGQGTRYFQAHMSQYVTSPNQLQGSLPNNLNANAFIVSLSTVMDPSWYMHSGTNHITVDAQNLSHKTNYKGLDKLSVCNGAKLDIIHVGSSLIPSHTSH